jgi:hypothetical protein
MTLLHWSLYGPEAQTFITFASMAAVALLWLVSWVWGCGQYL